MEGIRLYNCCSIGLDLLKCSLLIRISLVLKARIIGLGSYLPERLLSNRDLEQMVDTNEEWIARAQAFASGALLLDEMPSDMGSHEQSAPWRMRTSIRKRSDPDPCRHNDVRLHFSQHGCPHSASATGRGAPLPSTWVLPAQAFFMRSQWQKPTSRRVHRRILVVATEKMSAFIDYTDRNTCVLFGDGAGAAIVSLEGEGLSVDQIASVPMAL